MTWDQRQFMEAMKTPEMHQRRSLRFAFLAKLEAHPRAEIIKRALGILEPPSEYLTKMLTTTLRLAHSKKIHVPDHLDQYSYIQWMYFEYGVYVQALRLHMLSNDMDTKLCAELMTHHSVVPDLSLWYEDIEMKEIIVPVDEEQPAPNEVIVEEYTPYQWNIDKIIQFVIANIFPSTIAQNQIDTSHFHIGSNTEVKIFHQMALLTYLHSKQMFLDIITYALFFLIIAAAAFKLKTIAMVMIVIAAILQIASTVASFPYLKNPWVKYARRKTYVSEPIIPNINDETSWDEFFSKPSPCLNVMLLAYIYPTHAHRHMIKLPMILSPKMVLWAGSMMTRPMYWQPSVVRKIMKTIRIKKDVKQQAE